MTQKPSQSRLTNWSKSLNESLSLSTPALATLTSLYTSAIAPQFVEVSVLIAGDSNPANFFRLFNFNTNCKPASV